MAKKTKKPTEADREWYRNRQCEALWDVERLEQGLEEMFRRQKKRMVIV